MSLQATSPDEAKFRIQYRPSEATGTHWWYVEELKNTWFGTKFWDPIGYEFTIDAAKYTLEGILRRRSKVNETYYYK